jgi:hypothetical protein
MVGGANEEVTGGIPHPATQIEAWWMGFPSGTLATRLTTELGPFQQGTPQQALALHQDLLYYLPLGDESGSLLPQATSLCLIHRNTSIIHSSALSIAQKKTGVKTFSQPR